METETSSLDELREEMSQIPLNELKAMQEKLGLKEPTELSARRPVPKTHCVAKEKITRDPRFDDLSGEFHEQIFKKTYSFLSDVKTKEKMKLKKLIEKTIDKERKSELKQLYNRLVQRELAEVRRTKREELERQWKKEEFQKVQEGKKPYFLKNSEKKALLDAEFKKELEETGKMQKYLTRKSKKLAAKEKRKNAWSTKDI